MPRQNINRRLWNNQSLHSNLGTYGDTFKQKATFKVETSLVQWGQAITYGIDYIKCNSRLPSWLTVLYVHIGQVIRKAGDILEISKANHPFLGYSFTFLSIPFL